MPLLCFLLHLVFHLAKPKKENSSVKKLNKIYQLVSNIYAIVKERKFKKTLSKLNSKDKRMLFMSQ